SYAAMAIYAISARGKRLQIELVAKLARNWLWLRDKISISLPISTNDDQKLDQHDWQLLSGFAFAHRPYDASYPSLCRLKQQLPDLFDHPLPPTVKLLGLPDNEWQIINKAHLTGKQTLIKQLRADVQIILQLCAIQTPLFPSTLDSV
ncbi:tRNA-binding protein, partial [Candidatus Schmidhempelia bombi]